MSKGYDKTFKESYTKAVALSKRDKVTVYVVKIPLGYRALTIQGIVLTNSNKKPEIRFTVYWRGDIE